MRATTLVTGLLAGSVLAGCHHRQSMEEQGPVTTTTTTSTTTSMEPVASSTSSTSTSSTSPMPMSEPRRPASGSEMHNDMRMERREVHLAIASLERVRHELEHAGHEFGGRKGGALKATDAALHELRLVRGQEARDERAGMESPRERRREERELHVALADLERARMDMEHAKHDFRGRRKEAIETVDAAIREIRLAAEHEK